MLMVLGSHFANFENQLSNVDKNKLRSMDMVGSLVNLHALILNVITYISIILETSLNPHFINLNY